jgi:hypothetical protein
VHAAVVLLPLAAVFTVVCSLVPRSRRAYAPLALAFAVLALVFTYVAKESGESLEHDVHRTALVRAHAEQGDTVLPWAFGVAAAAGGATWLSRRTASRAVTTTVAVVAVVAGLGATYSIVRVGHSGAKAVWSETEKDER